MDFCCLSERIVLEVDGNVHQDEQRRGYDAARAGFLQAAGYRVLRIANRDVDRENLERLLRKALGTSHP